MKSANNPIPHEEKQMMEYHALADKDPISLPGPYTAEFQNATLTIKHANNTIVFQKEIGIGRSPTIRYLGAYQANTTSEVTIYFQTMGPPYQLQLPLAPTQKSHATDLSRRENRYKLPGIIGWEHCLLSDGSLLSYNSRSITTTVRSPYLFDISQKESRKEFSFFTLILKKLSSVETVSIPPEFGSLISAKCIFNNLALVTFENEKILLEMERKQNARHLSFTVIDPLMEHLIADSSLNSLSIQPLRIIHDYAKDYKAETLKEYLMADSSLIKLPEPLLNIIQAYAAQSTEYKEAYIEYSLKDLQRSEETPLVLTNEYSVQYKPNYLVLRKQQKPDIVLEIKEPNYIGSCENGFILYKNAENIYCTNTNLNSPESYLLKSGPNVQCALLNALQFLICEPTTYTANKKYPLTLTLYDTLQGMRSTQSEISDLNEGLQYVLHSARYLDNDLLLVQFKDRAILCAIKESYVRKYFSKVAVHLFDSPPALVDTQNNKITTTCEDGSVHCFYKDSNGDYFVSSSNSEEEIIKLLTLAPTTCNFPPPIKKIVAEYASSLTTVGLWSRANKNEPTVNIPVLNFSMGERKTP